MQCQMSDSNSHNTDISLPMLPANRIESRGDDAYVFDIIRNKWVLLTPEEFVRQRFVEWLILVKGYSRYRIANEIGLTVNRRRRRCDTVVFAADNNPLIVIEYKAPQVCITQKVFDQIVRYNSVLRATFLVVTNGISMYCCEMNYTTNTYSYISRLPDSDSN